MSYFHRTLSGDTIEMDEEFVGNQNALPLCPKTDVSGWCRKYVGGPPTKMAVINTGTTGTVAQASTAVSSVISSIFGALSSGSTGVTKPATPIATSVRPAAMSTTTKVALAGGAVLLVALLARR